MIAEDVVGTVIGIVIFAVLVVLIGLFAIEWDKRKTASRAKVLKVEVRKSLWVPAEAWSRFCEIIVPLGNYHEHAKLVIDVHHRKGSQMFEWSVWPDLIRDGMWLQYVCRRSDYEEYIERHVEVLNRDLERPIRMFEGAIPEEEAKYIG